MRSQPLARRISLVPAAAAGGMALACCSGNGASTSSGSSGSHSLTSTSSAESAIKANRTAFFRSLLGLEKSSGLVKINALPAACASAG